MSTHPSAGERVLAFVAGYPSSVRAAKPLVFLQAYIDDSAADSGDARLFMAGYLNTVDNWARFSDAWQAELNYPHAIEYLRMVEANGLRGQFAGWGPRQRTKKLARLAGVIRQFRPETFQWTVDRRDFQELIAPYAPRGLASPHYLAAFGVVAMVTRYLTSRGIKGKIDFIFDQQSGVSADMPLFFDYMTRSLPREARKMISGIPLFRDDKDMVPLQAADMLAWHLRRQHEKGDVAKQLDALLHEGGGHLAAHVDRATLARVGRGFEQIPGTRTLQSKPQWQKFRTNLAGLKSTGFVPPYGSWWRNLLFEVRQSLRWLRTRR